jgi:hypothetical protein
MTGLHRNGWANVAVRESLGFHGPRGDERSSPTTKPRQSGYGCGRAVTSVRPPSRTKSGNCPTVGPPSATVAVSVKGPAGALKKVAAPVVVVFVTVRLKMPPGCS